MQNPMQFFETDSPRPFHIGLRMIKTAVAVYICAIIGYLRGEPAFFSIYAAVFCMQNTTGQSLVSSLDRVLGTFIGGLFGVLLRYVGERTGFYDLLPLYYLAIAVLMIPIMLLTIKIRKPSLSAFACTVFVSVALTSGQAPLDASIQRILDTLIGIATALIVNIVLPTNHNGYDDAADNSDCKKPCCDTKKQAAAPEDADGDENGGSDDGTEV